VTWLMWNLILVHSETALVLEQARCMTCAKRTIGSKIVLDAPDGTPMFRAQVEAHFVPFRVSANLDAR
jgi:hypothetical protein